MRETHEYVEALSVHMPSVMRWAGTLARQLRQFNIAIEGKESGSPNTDALTIADLTVQELIVSALRDSDPILRDCRIDGEEETGDMSLFNADSELAITIDPIDGTRQFRDHTGNGYAVMLQLQGPDDVFYSLVFIPESSPNGTWVEARDGRLVVGEDDPTRTARQALDSLPLVSRENRPDASSIYLIGFQDEDPLKAELVTGAGLKGHTAQTTPGSIYELMARGDFAGSLIHSPNIYDFPVSMQIARMLGGDAVWVDTREPVHLRETWMDERASMLRLPRIVACSEYPEVLETLCELAKDWHPIRYAEDR